MGTKDTVQFIWYSLENDINRMEVEKLQVAAEYDSLSGM